MRSNVVFFVCFFLNLSNQIFLKNGNITWAKLISGCGEHLIQTLLAKTCSDAVRSSPDFSGSLSTVFQQEFLGLCLPGNEIDLIRAERSNGMLVQARKESCTWSWHLCHLKNHHNFVFICINVRLELTYYLKSECSCLFLPKFSSLFSLTF